MSNEPITTKYRPTSFEELIGNEPVNAALFRALSSETTRPHAYLLTGPSGIGKTTTARIIASHLQAEVIEIDAASNSGVDAMRMLVEVGNHMALSGAGVRMFIIDECFARGSRVFTLGGPRNIESIRVGDYVIGACGPNPVKRIITTSVELTRIIKLHLANGQYITCSEDHAFLTDKGWVAAKELTGVQSISTILSDIPRDMLNMWDIVYEQRRGGKILRRVCEKRLRSFLQNLSRMWKGIPLDSLLLLTRLWLQNCGPQTARASAAGMERLDVPCGSTTREFTEGQGNRRTGFTTNAETQPHARSREYRQDGGNEAQKWDTDSQKSLARWKWSRPLIRAIQALRRGWRTDGIRCVNSQPAKGISLPARLQNRLGISPDNVGDRDRRARPPEARDASVGSQERPMFADARVESAAYLQPADIERLRRNGETRFVDGVECADFYDLEIENHPSYNIEELIVHNCHSLSKAAWTAILKLLEEPPSHLYIALCTTELHKVPETIVTRCYHVALRPLRTTEVEDLLIAIADLEGWQVQGDVMQAVISAATGQPRKALSILQAVHDAPSRDEVRRIITLMDASDPLIALCQHLLSGKKSWKIIREHLEKLEVDDFEEASVGAGRYIMAAMTRAESEGTAQLAWRLLDALLFPTTTYDKKAAFFAAVGRMLWG